MDINQAFPSKYLSAADLQGRPAMVRMGDVTKEVLDREEKLILSLQGKKKQMVLNKTNAMKIAELHGNETNDWYDKIIEIYAAEVDFQGRSVDAIRVRAPRTETRSDQRSEPRREPQREQPGAGLRRRPWSGLRVGCPARPAPRRPQRLRSQRAAAPCCYCGNPRHG